jgi:hypothetical protein
MLIPKRSRIEQTDEFLRTYKVERVLKDSLVDVNIPTNENTNRNQ